MLIERTAQTTTSKPKKILSYENNFLTFNLSYDDYTCCYINNFTYIKLLFMHNCQFNLKNNEQRCLKVT